MYQETSVFFAEASRFIQLFERWAKQYAPAAIADHICYKCGDTAEFEEIRALFEQESTYHYQSLISKRRITIIKFLQPLKTVLGDIWFLELSDQKPDGSQTSGFDHIEIYPKDRTIEALAEELEKKGVILEKIVRPHHTTFDGIIDGYFKIRLENEALIEKIKQTEL